MEIYYYERAHQFLQARWKIKKAQNPTFSMRAWAKKLGMKSTANLSLMLAGKRGIPEKYVPELIQDLELGPEEAIYLETLLRLENAQTKHQTKFYLERLNYLRPKTLKLVNYQVDSFLALGNPLHSILLEMTELKGFRYDLTWIKKHLCVEANETEIKECIERLLGLGLLQVDKNNGLKKTQKHLTNRLDIADLGSQEYHKRVSQWAAKAVRGQSVSEREFNGYALNIEKSQMPFAKHLIREFIQEFIQKIEATPKKGEATYQFNVQFFKLSTLEEN